MGAWMVLPFAGLEIFLVGLGMYYVSWKLSFREVLIFENESLILQKGVYFPKQEWRWHKNQASILVRPSNYRMSAPHMWLYGSACLLANLTRRPANSICNALRMCLAHNLKIKNLTL